MGYDSDFFDFLLGCNMAWNNHTSQKTTKQMLEEELDEMYKDYQEYLVKLDEIKKEGYCVLRNSKGQHRVEPISK